MQRSVEIFKFDVWKVWKAACDAEKEKPWIIENTKYGHKCFLKERRPTRTWPWGTWLTVVKVQHWKYHISNILKYISMTNIIFHNSVYSRLQLLYHSMTNWNGEKIIYFLFVIHLSFPAYVIHVLWLWGLFNGRKIMFCSLHESEVSDFLNN